MIAGYTLTSGPSWSKRAWLEPFPRATAISPSWIIFGQLASRPAGWRARQPGRLARTGWLASLAGGPSGLAPGWPLSLVPRLVLFFFAPNWINFPVARLGFPTELERPAFVTPQRVHFLLPVLDPGWTMLASPNWRPVVNG